MSRVWFSQELETVATFWRVIRRDGVTLGFTTHDGDLWFDGVLHRAAPGMVPSAIRRSADFDADSAEVEGALAHDSIDARDLAAGRFDGARVVIGLVDWNDPADRFVLYRGTIGTVSEDSGTFSAALESRKTELRRDPVPRTSPTCRAEFCGPRCNLSAAAHDHPGRIVSADIDGNWVEIAAAVDIALLAGGDLRWLDGSNCGQRSAIAGIEDGRLLLSAPLDSAGIGSRVILREGCDRTITTCAARFGNAVNFQGEPYLPGNDMIARYPAAS
ncbi:DUF2163 domain-containing protein [Novosphingobium flavum]|uniref:DUF2163 domain-containing protein n=1 Tax=Novosphingobium flavum TaxID=1778672 RepID=A0A7X1FQE0_9SPHN|nr:DUF2163 domain-containing protein [Novosphingobium flavum]MBC2665044.1 DUF2163 domain-containing protein [Novosphingobium flavum]